MGKVIVKKRAPRDDAKEALEVLLKERKRLNKLISKPYKYDEELERKINIINVKISTFERRFLTPFNYGNYSIMNDVK